MPENDLRIAKSRQQWKNQLQQLMVYINWFFWYPFFVKHDIKFCVQFLLKNYDGHLRDFR